MSNDNMTPLPRELAEQIYGYLADDEDARVCRDIPDEACDEQPVAFTLQLVAQTLTKVGDALVSARLVLAWMLASLGAPAIFIALLVPLRESLALLPQLFIAQAIRERAIRKTFWVVGSFGQAAALAAMVPVVWLLEGFNAGIGVTILLVVFSLSRGVCSVAAKDVLGKTVSRSRRGRLNGSAASAAGFITLAVAAAVIVGAGIEQSGAGFPSERALFVVILVVATLLWIGAAIVFARVPEVPGATEGGGNAFTEAIRSLSLLREDKDFRDFVIARALLVSTAFAIPYIVVLIQRGGDGDLAGLGALLLADGAAGLLSSPIWGRWSDAASHRVMAGAAALSVLVTGECAALHYAAVEVLALTPVSALVLFAAAVAHHGARVARKTYLVDMANSDNRAQYTAVGDTVIGLFLLAGVGLGALDTWLGTTSVLWLLMAIGVLAVVRSLALKSVAY
ncbi:MAG: MFS transporter permease [Gammaproteobacteria bacterium]|nr:MFS transporter permease [Gammaproteobacteria bacterium]